VASIYGKDLSTTGPAQSTLPGGSLELGDTQVIIGTQTARLLYTSRDQINFVMPNLTPGVYPIVVTTAAGTSEPKPISVEGAWPGIFAARVNGGFIEVDATGLGPTGTPFTILIGDVEIGLGNRVTISAVTRLPVPIPPGLHGPQPVRIRAGGH